MTKGDLSIAQIVASYGIALKRAGKEFLGLCPFHADKTPSLSVNADKGVFHCFGCGAGGDAIGFVMAIEGADFKGAIKILGLQSVQRHRRRVPSREAHAIADWANAHFLRAQGRLRNINQDIRLACELRWQEEIARLSREYQILENLADDLSMPKTALALYRQHKESVEKILGDDIEDAAESFPEVTEEYRERLRALVRGDA